MGRVPAPRAKSIMLDAKHFRASQREAGQSTHSHMHTAGILMLQDIPYSEYSAVSVTQDSISFMQGYLSFINKRRWSQI